MMKPLVLLSLLLLLLTAPAEPASKAWGWLGVRIRDLSEQEMEEISQKHGLREGFGVMIVEVMKETPAEASGLKNGDLVVAFRERPVVDTRTLQRLVASTSAGETVPLTVLRRDDAGRRRRREAKLRGGGGARGGRCARRGQRARGADPGRRARGVAGIVSRTAAATR